ncbi:hypothetical protein PFISCL1PPCAC_7697, partial [Pristionchus fissidentatus]
QMAGKAALISGRTVAKVGVVAVVLLAALLYRPLPAGMMSDSSDRIAMHVVEPLLRLFYTYPTALCGDAQCSLNWARGVMSWVGLLNGPFFNYDGKLHMRNRLWNDVKVRIYYPRDNSTVESDGAIVFIHGGGYAVGSTEEYEGLTKTMANMMSTRLFVSIDYRLAPETFFPGALEDCEKVLEYIIENGKAIYGVDPRKIVLMGDSAGGNAVAAITQRRRERKAVPKILGQVLLYPLLQLSDVQTYSYRQHKRELSGLAFIDPLTSVHYHLWYAGIDMNAHPEYARAALTNGHVNEAAKKLRDELMDYSVLPAEFRNDVGGTDLPVPTQPNKELMAQIGPFLTNPDFAPFMRRDLSNLPSALVVTCEYDVLRDEGAIYAHRLKKAGVTTQWSHYKHGVHGMFNFPKLKITQDALNEIKDWTMTLLLAD